MIRQFRFYVPEWDSHYIEANTEEEAWPGFWKEYDEFLEDRRTMDNGKWWKEYGPLEERPDDIEVHEIGQQEHKYGPRPSCCEQINSVRKYEEHKGPRIRLTIHDYDYETNTLSVRPRWIISETEMEIGWCPFCGFELPEVEKIEDPPPMWTPNDGRCGTCDERNGKFGNCECNPPSAGYKLV
jgi:hypothetical protein